MIIIKIVYTIVKDKVATNLDQIGRRGMTMSRIYRMAEMYLYRYSGNMYRLEILNDKLKYEEMHGDLKVQRLTDEGKSSGHGRGVENWYERCEVLREKIRRLQRMTVGITELYDELRINARYARKYEIMIGILEHVYIMGGKLVEYWRREHIPERTCYRRRYELVMRAAEKLGL